MKPGPTRRSELSDAAIWALLGSLVALPFLAFVAAHLSALITSGHLSDVGLDDATRAVPRLIADAGDPAAAFQPAGNHLPGPVGFWTTVAVLMGAIGLVAGWVGLRMAKRHGRFGMARRSQLTGLNVKAVAERVRVLRPDLPARIGKAEAIAAAGVRLGRHHPSGTALYGTIEDSYAVVAPPRTGKTVRVVIPTVLGYQGPAVVTSTRWEVVDLTAAVRARQGPVWVFDADQSSTSGLPPGVREAAWSPVAGCEDPQTAMIRARSLARAAGASNGVDNAEFWATHATTVLQSYLHAAALGDHSIADVRRWALDPTKRDPVTLLRSSPAARDWSTDLLAQMQVREGQRHGVWGVVQQSLAALANPALLTRCDPAPGDGFDPADLLNQNGTLYIVGRAETQDVVAPLVAALVEAVVSTARGRAARSTGGRLAPSLLVALDEVANIAPIPTLPTLVADGGGSGITTLIVLQSRAQARQRWGEDAAEAIVAACTHRLILGGGGELRELDDLTRLVGERDEEVRSHSWQPWSTGGTASTSTTLRRVPIITPADLQALPKGRGILCSPNAPPAEVTLDGWWQRPDAPQLRSAQAATEPREADEPTEESDVR